VLLEYLAEGAVTLTTVGLLAPHLTEANHREVLTAARYRSKRQVEELVARLHPQPAVPTLVRRLPSPRLAAASAPELSEVPTDVPADAATSNAPPALDLDAAGLSRLMPAGPAGAGLSGPLTAGLAASAASARPTRPATVEPLAPERYKVQVTVDKETYDRLRFAQALLRHQIPDGDVAAIVGRAVGALVEALLKEKVAATERPRESSATTPHSRHIPAAVKRAVWLRDGGRCAFVSRRGRRCAEEGLLEFHHVKPFAVGGAATMENIELRCRAHNRDEAERFFGRRKAHVVRESDPSYAIARAAACDSQLGPDPVQLARRRSLDEPSADDVPGVEGSHGAYVSSGWPPSS
jgi:hypothetical protein